MHLARSAKPIALTSTLHIRTCKNLLQVQNGSYKKGQDWRNGTLISALGSSEVKVRWRNNYRGFLGTLLLTTWTNQTTKKIRANRSLFFEYLKPKNWSLNQKNSIFSGTRFLTVYPTVFLAKIKPIKSFKNKLLTFVFSSAPGHHWSPPATSWSLALQAFNY